MPRVIKWERTVKKKHGCYFFIIFFFLKNSIFICWYSTQWNVYFLPFFVDAIILCIAFNNTKTMISPFPFLKRHTQFPRERKTTPFCCLLIIAGLDGFREHMFYNKLLLLFFNLMSTLKRNAFSLLLLICLYICAAALGCEKRSFIHSLIAGGVKNAPANPTQRHSNI